PIGLPIAISAFHFHNLIPTVSRSLGHDRAATRKAIFIGIFLGLIINLVWVTIVLGSLPRLGTAEATIEAGFLHQVPANVPMSFLLHSRLFLVSGFVFAILSVTASYMANGTGLHGFVRDLSNTYLRSDNAWLIAALAFVPPLVIALLCPDIFLGALDIVGGVGESTLFVLLPGIILLHFSRGRSRALFAAGLVMVAVGGLTTIYVLAEKAGLVDLASFPGA
ncbi:MAG TPA: aromatic amino acid transport family protein, partial [bacterium]|nr:aromatic amino acid transport family protein [bacterium]